MKPLDYAQAYAAIGWPVFPCGRNKTPLLAKPEGSKGGFHQATTNPEQIREWWQKHPKASIGIASGAAGVFCVDQDAKDGGPELFDSICGPNPHGASYVSVTPGGGRHHIYAQPQLGEPVGVMNGCWKGIDVKGDGGYFVAPNGIDGRAWGDESPVDDAADGEFVELDQPPQWLLPQLPRKRADRGGVGVSLPDEGYREAGDSNHSRTSADLLEVLFNDSTIDAARYALEVTGANPDGDYDQWLAPMMELNELGPEGRSLAMAWSSQSASHDERDREKFATFSGARGIGSLFYRAEQVQSDFWLDYRLKSGEVAHEVNFGCLPDYDRVDRLIAQFYAAELDAPEEARTLLDVVRPVRDPRIRPAERRYLFRDGWGEDGKLLPAFGSTIGMLARGECGQLCSPGGLGKTFALIAAGVSVITGRPWLGRFVPDAADGDVLLALGEESSDEVDRRIHTVCKAQQLTDDEVDKVRRRLKVLPGKGLAVGMLHRDRSGNLRTTAARDELRQVLESCENPDGWALVVLDPLSRWGGPGTDSDNDAATRVVQEFESILRSSGNPTVLCAQHSSKSAKSQGKTDSRGVTALTDGFRWEAHLTKLGAGRVGFSVPKSNYSPEVELFALERGENGNLLPAPESKLSKEERAEVKRQEASAEVQANAREAVRAVMAMPHDSDGYTATQIFDALEGVIGRRSSKYAAAKNAKAYGWLEHREGKGTKARPNYFLTTEGRALFSDGKAEPNA